MDEAWLHDLMSVRHRDPASQALRGVLSVASCGYGSIMTLRNLAYDRGWFTITRAPVPVISLGNLTTGGTGKTPLAAWLAQWLVEQGCRPGLLSRGYHSLKSNGTGPSGNDEKMVLDRLCPEVPHRQQKDRVQSARQIVEEHGCDVLILDDGFQHRRLFRDLDLLLIDALQPWGYGHVLPRGLMRESKSGIRRAGVVLITRCDQLSVTDRQHLKKQIANVRGSNECVEVAFGPKRLIGLNGEIQQLELLKGSSFYSFCGIGNPKAFEQSLKSIGNLIQFKAYPDHYHYQAEDLRMLAEAAHGTSADIVVTTLKDLVKISLDQWQGPPLYALDIAAEFLSGEEVLIDRLKRLIEPIVCTRQVRTEES